MQYSLIYMFWDGPLIGLPVSKCHLSSQSDETQWMFGEILLLKYVSSSCRFNLHFYLYGLSLLYSG